MSHMGYCCLMTVDRDQVLRSAAALLTRKSTATMDEVAKAAGISRATLHRHFAGRDALVRALEGARHRGVRGGSGGRATRRRHRPGGRAPPGAGARAQPPDCSRSSTPRTSCSRARSSNEGWARIDAAIAALFRRGQESGEFRIDLTPAWLTEALYGLIGLRRLGRERGPGRRQGLQPHDRRAVARRCTTERGDHDQHPAAGRRDRRKGGVRAAGSRCPSSCWPCCWWPSTRPSSVSRPRSSARTSKPSGTQLLWIGDVYSFVIAGLLVSMGSLGDRIGRKKLLLIGATAFGAVSVLNAYATTPEMMILARALLGVAGATLMPSTLALIRNLFHDPRERSLAVGIWGATASAGTAVGPVVGGFLLEHFWWGSVFLINLPVMAVLVARRHQAAPRVAQPGAGPVGPAQRRTVARRHDRRRVRASRRRRHTASRGRRRGGGPGAARLCTVRAPSAHAPRPAPGHAALPPPGVHRGGPRRPADHPRPVRAGLLPLAVSCNWSRGGDRWRRASPNCPRRSARWRRVCSPARRPGATRYGPWSPAGSRPSAWPWRRSPWSDRSTGYPLLGAALLVVGVGAGLSFTVTSDVILSSVPKEQAGAASAVSETAYELGAALGIALLGSIVTGVYRDFDAPTGTAAARPTNHWAARWRQRHDLPPHTAEALVERRAARPSPTASPWRRAPARWSSWQRRPRPGYC